MNNNIWEGFIQGLYGGFHNEIEVMSVVGYRQDSEHEGTDIIEYVDYYTSLDESEILGNFREIVKGMADYVLLRGKDARFLFVHNHPRGTAEPSESDRLMTSRFQVVCRMFGATCMGSYIYIEDGEILLIGGKEEEFITTATRNNNQFQEGGRMSHDRFISVGNYLSISRAIDESDYNGHRLNEARMEQEVTNLGYEQYVLIELDDENNIQGLYEVDKLQPNLENRENLELRYHIGMTVVFKRNKTRLALYDKRTGLERDELGLAEDARDFIKALGVCGYPVNFYIH